MRVAVIGQGAIGCLIADALIAHADVLRVDRTRAPLRGDEPRVDVALVCVKTGGTVWAAGAARGVLAPRGVAVTLQNGLGNLEVLASAVGRERASAGSVHTGAYLADDRVVVASGPLRLTLARGEAGERVDALAALFRRAGIEVALVDEPAPLLWRKAIVNAAVNPVSAILGVRNGALPGHAAGALVADALAREASRVATAVGVPVGEAEAEQLWRDAAAATATNLSSMLQDVRAGRVSEIDAICGAIAREGARSGVAAPLSAAMVAVVRALVPDTAVATVSPATG